MGCPWKQCLSSFEEKNLGIPETLRKLDNLSLRKKILLMVIH